MEDRNESPTCKHSIQADESSVRSRYSRFAALPKKIAKLAGLLKVMSSVSAGVTCNEIGLVINKPFSEKCHGPAQQIHEAPPATSFLFVAAQQLEPSVAANAEPIKL